MQDTVAERLLDRLEDCRRSFERAAVLGGAGAQVAARLAGGRGGIQVRVVAAGIGNTGHCSRLTGLAAGEHRAPSVRLAGAAGAHSTAPPAPIAHVPLAVACRR